MKEMFIGGRWLAARDERSLPVVSPADGETFDRIACGGAHEKGQRVEVRQHRGLSFQTTRC